ncbi:MAG: exonuclease domain-containing protein [Candidatus Omnitrophica bacterium]|nr:exonuclease domain-containing protein [Candidatus Omnitrophota bacterium]
MKIDEATFAIFDFETTGLYPYSGDMICEVACVMWQPSKRGIRKFHSLVNPGRPISYGAHSVNGINDDMVKDSPIIEDILPGFLKFIEGSVLVAYNAGFDLGFLEAALGEEKNILKDYYVVDALTLARRLFHGIGRYNLGNVSMSLGIDPEGEHRALADVMMTWRVFKKELDILKSEGVDTIADIAYIPSGRKRKPAALKVKDYKVKLIEEAIREEKRLSIVYRSVWNDSVTKRIITPKEIRFGYDRSYVIAHCHLKNEERNFRVDGIVDISSVP